MTMKLFYTPTSPFARKARIVVRERNLADQVREVEVTLRSPQNEVLAFNPAGKVPTLVVEDGPDKGLVLAESATVSEYLAEKGEGPPLQPQSGHERWKEKALDAFATALQDSITWHAREARRPANERSPGFMEYEAERTGCCLDALEKRVEELAEQEVSLGRILIAVALDFSLLRLPDRDWRPGRPALCAWHMRISQRPSFTATAP